MCQPNPSYDADQKLAEFYDLTEKYQTDLLLIRRLLEPCTMLRILEPFCGTGRILLPLAEDGHDVVGMDASRVMLDRAERKLAAAHPSLHQRVRLLHADCTRGPWPDGFGLVLLAANCLYELSSANEQEAWLGRCGFVIESEFGDRDGSPLTESSSRAIFWCRKT